MDSQPFIWRGWYFNCSYLTVSVPKWKRYATNHSHSFIKFLFYFFLSEHFLFRHLKEELLKTPSYLSFSHWIMHPFLFNGSSIFSTNLRPSLDLLIFLYFQPFPPSTSTHSCFLVKKRSSLLAEVTRVLVWLPMMCSCLNMAVLEVLLVIRVSQFLQSIRHIGFSHQYQTRIILIKIKTIIFDIWLICTPGIFLCGCEWCQNFYVVMILANK